jgi:hypothetical protein
MKISNNDLKRIIKEELEAVNEYVEDMNIADSAAEAFEDIIAALKKASAFDPLRKQVSIVTHALVGERSPGAVRQSESVKLSATDLRVIVEQELRRAKK